MKKLILLLLLCTSLVTAPATFSPAAQGGIIYSDSVVMKITTSTESVCGYSSSESESFESIAGNFDDNLETIHKKTLTGLSSTVHRYYVKCRPIDELGNSAAETTEEVVFKTSSPIAAYITVPDSILQAGKHKITLQTTKIPKTTPLLKYTFDGIEYESIILHGSENSWSGYLVISETTGEEMGSFKFEAEDLEGRSGSKIHGDSVFEIDTKAPSTISSIEAYGEYGQIELEWVLEEDEEVDEIRIYKSEEPGVDKTNLYKTLSGEKEDYTDTQVTKGKTYYYRIAAVDEAGNVGDLSREIQATALISSSSSTSSSGLSSSLHGLVDSFLSEISLINSDITSSQNTLDTLDSTEKEYAKIFKVTDDLQNAKSELSTLQKTVERFKETDITKEDLESKLDASKIKLEMIRKKIPEDFSSKESTEITFTPTEDSIRTALLKYSPELTSSEINKIIKKSLSKIEDSNLKIKSKINIFQTRYLDGTSEVQTIIEHELTSELEKSENSKFLLNFPTGSLDLSSLSIKNLEYSEEQEGLVSFETDIKKITYTLDDELNTEILKEISISPIELLEEQSHLTGYFLSEIPSGGSTTVTILILATLGLVAYLFFIKQQQQKEVSLEFISKAKKVKSLQKSGKTEEANSLYSELKAEYIGLTESQKHEVFKEVKELSK